jgi:hypothetical protein
MRPIIGSYCNPSSPSKPLQQHVINQSQRESETMNASAHEYKGTRDELATLSRRSLAVELLETLPATILASHLGVAALPRNDSRSSVPEPTFPWPASVCNSSAGLESQGFVLEEPDDPEVTQTRSTRLRVAPRSRRWRIERASLSAAQHRSVCGGRSERADLGNASRHAARPRAHQNPAIVDSAN